MRKPILVVVSSVVLVIGFAAVFSGAAADGGDPNLIHACVEDDGDIRIVNPSEGCTDDEESPLHWNPQHPILVLPGENGVDLSGFNCDPQILFFVDPVDSTKQARLVYECGPEAFSFRVPDGAGGERRILSVSDGFLDLSGMSVIAPEIKFGTGTAGISYESDIDTYLIRSNVGGTQFAQFDSAGLGMQNLGADARIRFPSDSGAEPGIAYIRASDRWEIDFDDGTGGTKNGIFYTPGIFQIFNAAGSAINLDVRDGLLDMSGMSGPSKVILFKDTFLPDHEGRIEYFNDGTLFGTQMIFGAGSDGTGFGAFEFRVDDNNIMEVRDGVFRVTQNDGTILLDVGISGGLGGMRVKAPDGTQILEASDEGGGLFNFKNFMVVTENVLDLSGMHADPRINFADNLAFSSSGNEVLSLSDGLLDASNSSIKGKIFSSNKPDCETEIEDGGFVFWDSPPIDEVKIILRIGTQCFETDMTDMGRP